MAGAGTETTADDPLWPLWRAVISEFGLARLLAVTFFSRMGWGMHDVDLVGSLRRTRMMAGLRRVTRDVPDDQLERLGVVARINAERNEAMWRMIVVLYVTVPVTALLAFAQALPGLARIILAEGSTVLWVAILLLALWMLYYLATYWRARQIVAALDLLRVERGVT